MNRHVETIHQKIKPYVCPGGFHCLLLVVDQTDALWNAFHLGKLVKIAPKDKALNCNL